MELEAAIGPLYNITIGYSTIKGASKYLWILIGVGIDFVCGFVWCGDRCGDRRGYDIKILDVGVVCVV